MVLLNVNFQTEMFYILGIYILQNIFRVGR